MNGNNDDDRTVIKVPPSDHDQNSNWTIKSIKDPVCPETTLPKDEEYSIGRSDECDLVLPSQLVSRIHAVISSEGDNLTVTDKGSSNGTFVNKKQIQEHQLENGDVINIDTYELQVQLVEQGVDSDATIVMPIKSMEADSRPEPDRPGPDIKKQNKESEQGSEPENSAAKKAWWQIQEEGVEGTVFVSDADMENMNFGASEQKELQIEVNQPSLVSLSGEFNGKIFQLSKEQKNTIGRADTNSIVLDEDSISVEHAYISFDNGAWKLVDVLSSNGTFINGNKTQQSYLSANDQITIGRLEFKFLTGSSAGNNKSGRKRVANNVSADTKYSENKSGKNQSKVLLFTVVFLITLILLYLLSGSA